MTDFASKLLNNLFATSVDCTAAQPAASAFPTMRPLTASETKAVAGGPQIINVPR